MFKLYTREPTKEMVTHSSIPAWRIPWTEEPGATVYGVPRVRHHLATKPSSQPYKMAGDFPT